MYRSVYLIFALLLVGCAAIPGKDNPPAYTQAIVQDAIRLYKREGRQAIIDRYRSRDNVDGQWYVFILDEDKRGLAHYNPDRIGADASLAPYGDELTSATAEGKWFSHMNVNPETGTEQLKHFWIILYDGLTFASGWYEE